MLSHHGPPHRAVREKCVDSYCRGFQLSLGCLDSCKRVLLIFNVGPWTCPDAEWVQHTELLLSRCFWHGVQQLRCESTDVKGTHPIKRYQVHRLTQTKCNYLKRETFNRHVIHLNIQTWFKTRIPSLFWWILRATSSPTRNRTLNASFVCIVFQRGA